MRGEAGAFALWPVRLAVASVFLVHGWWMLTDHALYVRIFEAVGIPFASPAAWLVGVAEFFGAFGLLAGVLVRFTSAVLAVVMVTAILVAWLPDGEFYGGWAFDLVILGGLLALLVNGPGRPTIGSVLGRAWTDPEDLVWARLRRTP